MSYLCKIHWSWGRDHRFKEVTETRISDKDNIDSMLKQFIKHKVKHYSYDCNRLYHPLNLEIHYMELIPITETEDILFEDTGLQQFLDNEVEWIGELIKTEKIYINGQFNTETSPKNK